MTPQQIEAKAEELRLKIITCKEADDHAVIGDFLTSFAAEVRAEARNDVLEEAAEAIHNPVVDVSGIQRKIRALKSDTTKGEQL